jgi:hypothetical protein
MSSAAMTNCGAAIGKRNVKVLPWRTPSLWACSVPPCISASRRDSARPMPSPACCGASGRCSRANISKMRSSASRSMPAPLSRTRIATCGAITLGGDRDVPAGRRVLHRIVDDVRHDLRQPHGVALEPDRLVGDRDLEPVLRGLDERTARLDGVCTIVATSTRSKRISSVPRLMRPISSRSSTSRTRWFTWRSMMSRAWVSTPPSGCRACIRVQRVAQRRERVAQLVRQRGQEFVLAPVGLAQRVDRPAARLVRVQQCADAHEQLARRERLDEVVVGAALESFEPRLLARSGGQEQHRHRVERRIGA